MHCRRAIIHYADGKPLSYTLLLDGMVRPGTPRDSRERETTFGEALQLFPALRKHWKADGTAKE